MEARTAGAVRPVRRGSAHFRLIGLGRMSILCCDTCHVNIFFFAIASRESRDNADMMSVNIETLLALINNSHTGVSVERC